VIACKWELPGREGGKDKIEVKSQKLPEQTSQEFERKI
jgi:hypothetical protein